MPPCLDWDSDPGIKATTGIRFEWLWDTLPLKFYDKLASHHDCEELDL